MDGRLIKLVLLKQGESQTIIALPEMKAGVYLVRYKDGFRKVDMSKFLKQ